MVTKPGDATADSKRLLCSSKNPYGNKTARLEDDEQDMVVF